MKSVVEELFTHEFDELLKALRRDMRRQLELAEDNTPLADWHRINARFVIRILEALSPKLSTNTPCERDNFSAAVSTIGREAKGQLEKPPVWHDATSTT